MGVNDELLPESEYKLGFKLTTDMLVAFKRALTGTIVTRNDQGQVVGGQIDIGTRLLPIKTLHVNNISLDGKTLEIGLDSGSEPTNSEVVSRSSSENSIVSCKTSANSSQPKFIEVIPNTLNFKILATDTPLELIINGEAVTISKDITVQNVLGALDSANTLSPVIESYSESKPYVVDSEFQDYYERYAGEADNIYNEKGDVGFFKFNNVGSSVLLKGVGNKVAFIMGSTQKEIWTGYLSSSTETTQDIYNIRRRWAFLPNDNLCNELSFRSSNSRTATTGTTCILLNIGYVFIDRDNPNVPRIAYKEPVISSKEPTGNQTGDYWFNTARNSWNVYGDDRFSEVNRLPIAEVYTSSTKIEGYRCYYTRESFNKINTTEWDFKEDLTYKSPSYKEGVVNVFGNLITIPKNTEVTGEVTDGPTDINHTYYLYIKENGDLTFIKDHRPYYSNELRGYYHRGETWRCLANAKVTEVTTAGDSGSKNSFGDGVINGTFDTTYFPYEKYNTETDIPKVFYYKASNSGDTFDPSSGTISALGTVTVIYKTPKLKDITLRAHSQPAGGDNLNLPNGDSISNPPSPNNYIRFRLIYRNFFLETPSIKILKNNNEFILITATLPDEMNYRYYGNTGRLNPFDIPTRSNIGNQPSGKASEVQSFELKFSFTQEKQVRINNTLKHT